MQKYSKESVTFRLDGPNLSSITKEAEKTGISLNALVNQIIDKHVEWYSFEKNMVSFPQKLISRLLSKYTEEEIADLAKKIAKDEIKDIILLLHKKNSPEAFLNVIETWVKVSNFPYTHDVEDSVHTFIIQHDMGKKLSLYLSKLYEAVFDSFELKKAEFDITKNTVAFTVDTEKPQ
ncbi:MAG: hypothetical protein GWN01_16750 [Nitrosopumilaceae archaeon]|nr:hypothetical protein [Nitrosopumilaceae archaeon]NIU02483.1 hypothetical protein [Nitrosopumilaceae archaeon]NIU88944.1 hypothetical protein [Nitrosopumilaceae archaeon]NIV67055.1 hypothetical protein [Nitrosopumilaceae archaeon]NIX63084.1 hypothetical protein [Nitrosopumilaceae archaeon]